MFVYIEQQNVSLPLQEVQLQMDEFITSRLPGRPNDFFYAVLK